MGRNPLDLAWILAAAAWWAVFCSPSGVGAQGQRDARLTLLPIPNGGFEEGLKDWDLAKDKGISSVSTEQAASGTRSLKIEDQSPEVGSSALSARLSVLGPGLYELHGQVRVSSGSGLGVYVNVLDAQGAKLPQESTQQQLGRADNQWRPFAIPVYVSEKAAYLEAWIHSFTKSAVTANIDDLSFVYLGGFEDMKEDLQIVKQRLLDRALKGSPDLKAAGSFMASLREDGSWGDVDYTDQGRAGWKTSDHLQRALAMAKAYRHPESPLKGDEALKNSVLSALDFWTKNDFQNPNWFHNKIAVPKALSVLLLLMEGEPSEAQTEAALAIVRRAQLGMTGANLVWLAEVNITRGCLEGKPYVAQAAFDRIAREIQITLGEGIQPDFSFHQHGAQFYSGGYGFGFSVDCPRFAVLAHGTKFEFPEDRLDILSKYILDGQQWMARGKTFDYSACGRSLSRTGSKAGAAPLAAACESMAMAFPARRAEFEASARRLRGETAPGDAPLIGNRHFWRADFMAHHREGFYASVRMTSNRLIQTEKVNDENQRGKHLADGVAYIYRTGEEYHGIFPVWDWQRIPGTTCEQQAQPPEVAPKALGERRFVGGVSNGLYGLAAEDFARDGLSARKAWFFLDREFVCLGAGIACPTDNPVLTSINQCLLKGPVTVSDGSRRETAASGQRVLEAPLWVYHDGVGYVFPERRPIHLGNEPQTGSWWEINRKYPQEEVSQDVFSLWIDHGKRPADQGYCYVVAPAVPLDELDEYAGSLPFAVLQNTTRLQAVWHGQAALAQAAFWEAGEVQIPGGMTLGVNRPCLLMLQNKGAQVQITVSNPENQPLEVDVEVNKRLKGEGCDWLPENGLTRVRFQLPSGMNAGQSLTRVFELQIAA